LSIANDLPPPHNQVDYHYLHTSNLFGRHKFEAILAANFNNNPKDLNKFDHSKVISVDLNSISILRRTEKAITTGSEKEKLVRLALGQASIIGFIKPEIKEIIGLEIKVLRNLLSRIVLVIPLSLKNKRFLNNTNSTELVKWRQIIKSLLELIP